MDVSNERPDPYHVRDDRLTDVPGIGPVPNRPRSRGHFNDRRDSERHSQRHGSRGEEDLHNPPQRRKKYDIQPFKQECSDNTPATGKDKNRISASSELFVPEYRNSMQFLAESFDRNRRELKNEFTRQQALSGNGNHQNVDRTDQNRFYARDELQFRRSQVPLNRSPEPVRIKRESSIEVQSEAQPNTNETSGMTTLPNEQAEPTSTGGRDGPEQHSSPPSGSSPPVPSGQAGTHPDCRCPVGFDCPKKLDNLVDCRTLILEYGRFSWNLRRARAEELPPDLPAEDEPFVTLQETIPIIRLLDQIPVRGRMSMGIRHTFAKIQEWVRMMQNNSMTQEIVNESRVLEHLKRFISDDNKDLRRDKGVPEHIVEDLTYLYRKWDFGDLGVLARRGLIRHKPNGPLWPDPNWQWKRKEDYFGHGKLVNGQTWRTRAEMMRDGAHAPSIAGISGNAADGARSVVMGYHDEVRKEYYADIDQGETIYYYGTGHRRKPGDTEPTNLKDPVTHRVERVTRNSQGEGPTDATMALFRSYWTGQPVRVFRSWKAAPIVPHRPVTGYRYDGLYIVTAPELVKIERQIYRFKMERMTTGQGPLRHSGAPLQPENRGSRKRKRDG